MRRIAALVLRIAVLVLLVSLVEVSVAAQMALAQGDTQRPRVSSSSPSAGAVGVSITGNVTATFNEPVQPASIAFVLRDASNAIVPSSLSYSAATRTVTLDPQSVLQPGKTYIATLSAAADLAGNTLSPSGLPGGDRLRWACRADIYPVRSRWSGLRRREEWPHQGLRQSVEHDADGFRRPARQGL